jgi:uncharacterized membrane protein YphA (DoxX/SURF4 family)
MPPSPSCGSISAARVLARCLLASVFVIAGAVKLQEFAATITAANSSGGASTTPTTSTTPTLTYASRRLDLFLSSHLGASPSVLAALRPHHAILVALLGLGELVAGAAFALARRATWAAPALLGLLAVITPICHCFWLLPPAAAGLEFGHALKNAAIAGGLLLDMAAAAAEGGLIGVRQRPQGGSSRAGGVSSGGGGAVEAAGAARKEE